MMAAPTNPSHLLCALINQLRQHKPESSQITDEAATDGEAAVSVSEGSGRDFDDRGKVFSSIGFSESASPSRVLSPERFNPKRAAVLICLFEGENGELRVILTKRASNLSTHSGEVALPGGKAEAGDADDRETATREAKEEIGLDPSLVTIVAILEPFLSLHLLRVVPVIGVLSDKKAFAPILNTAEVEAIFDAPLEMFLKDENHRSEEREWMGEKYLLHYFDHEINKKKFLIWGLTASILIHAASVVFQQRPSFPEMKPIYKYPTNFKVGFTKT
ncbi:nudix hydrolase 15, mitochondrial-like [Dendrobium catenatum]|uniref:Nudix hydrolase 15, mitochondrial n=1 Tax=Dendrobium catenatum TaxID=906689 RepID=A0A2I0VIM7_9ASPA|nr:nudix hydrolase 15, mitochondrial-like [Dendrobium catenatum]PKU63267.1 Nudix hydrolase 15, mitochondrial [Dendrobium catenatum]